MAKKVVTFGELMLRLAPEGYYRFVQADTLGATFGGGEANVAVSLANYGLDAKFVSIFYSVFLLRFSLSFGSVFFLFASQAKRKKMNNN